MALCDIYFKFVLIGRSTELSWFWFYDTQSKSTLYQTLFIFTRSLPKPLNIFHVITHQLKLLGPILRVLDDETCQALCPSCKCPKLWQNKTAWAELEEARLALIQI